jgi:hypothetical protein
MYYAFLYEGGGEENIGEMHILPTPTLIYEGEGGGNIRKMYYTFIYGGGGGENIG